MTAEVFYQRAKDLVEAGLGEELVALDVQGGHCFGFNDVATSIWRKLDHPQSFESLRLALLDEYDVSSEQCVRDLEELLKDLVGKGLVRTTDSDKTHPS